MIRDWYRTLKATRFYRAFLQHRVWVAKLVIASPILFCFPLGSVAFVWVFLPLTLTLPAIFWLTGDGGVSVAIINSLLMVYLIALGPISLRIFTDLTQGYFAGLFAVFGKRKRALVFLEKTQNELNEWEPRVA
ncbi:hypothetical protein [Ruegeria jejuensis]|uniref:hypothetical protein n=1 Tax=Ruegeria jejuensis TaxID=3233338 RepID=UPI00355C3A16